MLVHIDPCIIVVDICAYRSFSGRYFDLRGHGYEWDGTAYTTYSVSRQIKDFVVCFAIARMLPSPYALFCFYHAGYGGNRRTELSTYDGSYQRKVGR